MHNEEYANFFLTDKPTQGISFQPYTCYRKEYYVCRRCFCMQVMFLYRIDINQQLRLELSHRSYGSLLKLIKILHKANIYGTFIMCHTWYYALATQR